MSESLVLIDSSAWIASLTGQPVAVTQEVSETLIPSQRAAINEIIRLELLTGARDDGHFAELQEQLFGVHLLPITESVWRLAERTRFALRKKGLLASVPDIVIASCAIVYGCELLHCDKHFDRIARHVPLKIYKPLRSKPSEPSRS
jgi:predicted nucleic acid-binding protein